MDNKSWLSHAIQEVLPDLNEGKLLAITTKLSGIGVESKEDLPFVSAEDLDDLLPPIKTRKLLQGLKARETDDRDQHDKELASVQQGTYTDDASLDTPHRPSNNWSSSYKVPWHKLPKALIGKCKVGERPEPRDRREMIKIIMDDVNGLHHLVKRKDLRKIAQDIVGKFSKSFADIINGEILGDGASSLLQQLESRKENLQRSKGCKRPKPAATATSEDLPAHKMAKIDLDSFGCIKNQWMPDLPEGESEDAQEEKKTFLQQEYEKSSWNIDSVHENMTATYSTQRHDIHYAKNIEDLFQQWPYLAEEKWLLNHFQSLTGIDLIEKLSNAFVKKGSRLFMYLQTKRAPGALVEAVNAIKTAVKVAGNQRAVTAGLPVILAAYFKEDISVLIRCYHETATIEQVELDASLPATPCIAVLGELYSATCTRMFVIVDRRVINCAVTSLQKAMLMTFACFYVFSIEYGGEVSSTLDFIQRFFVGINPVEGTKAVRGKKRGMQVSGKVIALANAMALFENEWNMSEL